MWTKTTAMNRALPEFTIIRVNGNNNAGLQPWRCQRTPKVLRVGDRGSTPCTLTPAALRRWTARDGPLSGDHRIQTAPRLSKPWRSTAARCSESACRRREVGSHLPRRRTGPAPTPQQRPPARPPPGGRGAMPAAPWRRDGDGPPAGASRAAAPPSAAVTGRWAHPQAPARRRRLGPARRTAAPWRDGGSELPRGTAASAQELRRGQPALRWEHRIARGQCGGERTRRKGRESGEQHGSRERGTGSTWGRAPASARAREQYADAAGRGRGRERRGRGREGRGRGREGRDRDRGGRGSLPSRRGGCNGKFFLSLCFVNANQFVLCCYGTKLSASIKRRETVRLTKASNVQ